MKKRSLFLLLLAALAVLTACSRSMNDVIGKEPSLTGTVTEVAENSILLTLAEEDPFRASCSQVWVSLDVEIPDSITHLHIGDKVTVYFDGAIAETFPGQINAPYAIILLEPADRSVNEVS